MEKRDKTNKNLKDKLLAVRKKIGQKIRQRRKEINLDVKVLSKKVDLSQSSISNIEKGKQSITAERLWQFSVALRCSPLKLLPPIPDELKKFDKNLKKIENEEAREFAKTIIKTIE